VFKQSNAAPSAWVDTVHEFVIDLDVADLAHPVSPVIEIRLLQPVGSQSVPKKSPQRVAIATAGECGGRGSHSHPGPNVIGAPGVAQGAKLLFAQPAGRARSCIEAEQIDRLAT